MTRTEFGEDRLVGKGDHGVTALVRASVVWLTTLAVFGGSVAWAGERQTVEAILVRVNDRIVTVSDFKERLDSELSQMPEVPSGEDLRRFTTMLFDTIVDEMVLLERAEEKGLTVDEEMVDQAMASLRKDNNLDTEEAFEAALESAGMTMEDLRERYRQSLVQQRVVQSEIRPTEITEEEVRQIYEKDKEKYRVPRKVELQQLFFDAGGEEPLEQVRSRARGLVERVENGADLQAEATLAGVELQDIGAIPEEHLRPERQAAIADLQQGQLSEPMATMGGFLVLKLVRRIPAGYQPFDELKEGIRREESMKAYQAQSQGLVSTLKLDYLVEVHRERLALVFDGWTDD